MIIEFRFCHVSSESRLDVFGEHSILCGIVETVQQDYTTCVKLSGTFP